MQLGGAFLLVGPIVQNVLLNSEFALLLFFLLEVSEQLNFVFVFFCAHLFFHFVEWVLHGLEHLTDVFLDSVLKFRRLDELAGVRKVACLHEFFVGGEAATIEHVLLDRVVEKERLLLHEAHCGSVLLQVVLLDVDSINQDLTKLGLVESEQQKHNCGLALAGLSHESDVVHRVNRQVEAAQNPLLGPSWVAEPNIFEFNLAQEISRDLQRISWRYIKRIDLRGSFRDRKHFGARCFALRHVRTV